MNTNAILRCQINVPELVEPAFFRGQLELETVEGQYGAQAKLKLRDGRITYLPIHIGEQLAAMKLEPGDVIQITKREVQEGQRKRVRWEATRASAAQVEAASVPAPAASEVVQPAANRANGNANGSTAHDPTMAHRKESYADAIRCSLTTAIEAAQAAEKHAAEMGRPLQFSSADIQGIASTLFIQASRDGWIDYLPAPLPATAPVPAVNGGVQ